MVLPTFSVMTNLHVFEPES